MTRQLKWGSFQNCILGGYRMEKEKEIGKNRKKEESMRREQEKKEKQKVEKKEKGSEELRYE